ncbi:MAG: response regulator [Candidatus Omnitrophica bacterium]|nr:response regulator [Candidatus Omnitrophota bacterium]
MAGEKIMIVDDDIEFLSQLKEIIQLSGYYPIVTYDSSSVLSFARKMEPDLILLDLRMDNVDGYEVAACLQHFPETAKIPIIAMTGFYDAEKYNQHIKNCNMKACLEKPFNPLDVIGQIENILSN